MAQVDSIHTLLKNMGQHDASDLHLKVGMSPHYRIAGDLRKVDLPPLTAAEIERLLSPVIPAARRAQYEEKGDLDFSVQTPDGQRYRFNCFRAGGGMNAAVRRVKGVVPSFETLHLPPIYRRLADQTNEGLILVCGVTGAGKSTTLAALLEHINEHRFKHIVTIEDPVEFAFRPRKAVVSQREIGIDIPDYAEGLKYLVRQDPDVIFIGEMRDHPTMSAALQAAETGHLVFSSLHTADTMQAFARILEFFPRNEHAFIRGALANCLRAICAQRLLPGVDPARAALVPATEVLLNTPTCRDMIRREQDAEMPTLIAASEKEGMHNFTSALAHLVKQELVARETAMKYAPNADALASLLRGIRTATTGVIGH